MNEDFPVMSPPEIRPTIKTNDPLKYCIWATISLLSLLLTPIIPMLYFGTLGFLKYNEARKSGIKESNCIIKHVVLVQIYLAAIVLVAVGLGISLFLRFLS
jgi:hypothetical protein